MFVEPKKIYNYFDSEYEIKRSTNGWWALDCCICGNNNRKLAVHFQYSRVKCWVCGYNKSVVNFVMDMEGVSYAQAIDILDNRKSSNIDLDYKSANLYLQNHRLKELNYIDMPKGFKTILEGEGVLADRARAYLIGRGFDLEVLDMKGVGYCSEQPTQKEKEQGEDDFFGYIIFPFKIEGRLAYFIGRDFIGNYLRYKNPGKEKFGVGKADLLYNQDALNIYDECCLLEGLVDAETTGENAMSSQGWQLSMSQLHAIQTAKTCKRLTLIPDAGKDGKGVLFYRHALVLACTISEYMQVRVVNLNPFEELGKDVNELGIERVQKAIDSTQFMGYGELIHELMSA